MIDIHTHILPNMDDGSKDVDESNQLLKILENEGVKLVCLTSHFYPNKESIDDFLIRRDKSFKQLNYQGNIELRLGSEVHFYYGISTSEDIEKLCIDGTNLLLLEMPFDCKFNDNVINEILTIRNRGIRIILAHIERYDVNEEILRTLKSGGIYIQVNTESFLGYFKGRRSINWFRQGFIDFIGSDSHNTKDRKPNYLKAIEILSKKFGEASVNNFIENCYIMLDKR